jgi:hypothetical protein
MAQFVTVPRPLSDIFWSDAEFSRGRLILLILVLVSTIVLWPITSLYWRLHRKITRE